MENDKAAFWEKKLSFELEGLVSENQPHQALAYTIAGSIGVRQYTPGSTFSNENDTDDWPVRITVEEVFKHLANLPQNKTQAGKEFQIRFTPCYLRSSPSLLLSSITVPFLKENSPTLGRKERLSQCQRQELLS